MSTTPPHSSFLSRYGVLLVGLLLVSLIIAVAGVGWFVFQSKATPPESRESTSMTADKAAVSLSNLSTMGTRSAGNSEDVTLWKVKPIAPQNQAEAQSMAKSQMDHFFKLTDWKEKAANVRDEARVRPLMEAFYTSGQSREPGAGALQSCQFFQAAGIEFIHMVYEQRGASLPLEIALVKDATGNYKLDWESFVGAGELSWQELMQQRPTEPKLLRAYAVLDDYYNYEFTDSKKYLCIKLKSPDLEQTLYAYIPVGSRNTNTFLGAISSQQLSPVCVKVAFPEQAQSNQCVQLVEIIANRWLLP